MVTVLVEKRGFLEKIDKAEKSASAGRPRRGEKPTAREPAVQDASPSSAGEQSASTSGDSHGDEPSASDRFRQISVFAYFKAEQRGFAPGHMWDDWLAAEREVDSRNVSGARGTPEPGRSGG